ncbi:hypothetical protein MJS38_18535, partial [Burkholderia gladioli]
MRGQRRHAVAVGTDDSGRWIRWNQHHRLPSQSRGKLLLDRDNRGKRSPCHGHAVYKARFIQMHVIHSVKDVITESDRKHGDKVGPVAQEKLRFEGVNSREQLSENRCDVLLPFERGGSDWTSEYDIVCHMDPGPFDVAIAHGLEVGVEMFSGNHNLILLIEPLRRYGALSCQSAGAFLVRSCNRCAADCMKCDRHPVRAAVVQIHRKGIDPSSLIGLAFTLAMTKMS